PPTIASDSTLSLHDALPISRIHIEQSMKRAKATVSESIPRQSLALLSKAAGSSFETLGNIPAVSRGTKGWGSLLRRIANATFTLDRKSTRLNSSHVKISYAV